eukprot:m.305205 g.305205  ORF g.305205 m.305205 type:complete len:313 (+) comp55284_c0_seq2:1007-1945(+)
MCFTRTSSISQKCVNLLSWASALHSAPSYVCRWSQGFFSFLAVFVVRLLSLAGDTDILDPENEAQRQSEQPPRRHFQMALKSSGGKISVAVIRNRSSAGSVEQPESVILGNDLVPAATHIPLPHTSTTTTPANEARGRAPASADGARKRPSSRAGQSTPKPQSAADGTPAKPRRQSRDRPPSRGRERPPSRSRARASVASSAAPLSRAIPHLPLDPGGLSLDIDSILGEQSLEQAHTESESLCLDPVGIEIEFPSYFSEADGPYSMRTPSPFSELGGDSELFDRHVDSLLDTDYCFSLNESEGLADLYDLDS